jgi:hypothetical protein
MRWSSLGWWNAPEKYSSDPNVEAEVRTGRQGAEMVVDAQTLVHVPTDHPLRQPPCWPAASVARQSA